MNSPISVRLLAPAIVLGLIAPAWAAAAADEAQAKSRMEAAGYADVSRLHQANAGEWMADAQRDGRPVMITLYPDGTVAPREKVDVAPAQPLAPIASPAPTAAGSAAMPSAAKP